MNDSEVTRQAHSAARTLLANRLEGERAFQRLLQHYPNDGMVYFQRANAFERIGAIDEAVDDYNRAIGLLKYRGWIDQAQRGLDRLFQKKQARDTSLPTVSLISSLAAEELERAAREFRIREPRAVIYDAAQILLQGAVDDYEHLSPVVAISALIQSWNFAYYKTIACDAGHLVDLEIAIHGVWQDCLSFRRRDIASFDREKDEPTVRHVFTALEHVLGRVGAPKAMHVIAPAFFPLWDNYIAPAYGITLGAPGRNTDSYLAFMEIVKQQAAHVRVILPSRPDVLKALDEYNYCRYSKAWI